MRTALLEDMKRRCNFMSELNKQKQTERIAEAEKKAKRKERAQKEQAEREAQDSI
jgi:hypothetical protein